MGYRYIDDHISADACFVANGHTLEEVFIASWEAALSCMINDPHSLGRRRTRRRTRRRKRYIEIEDETLDMLLFRFIEELVFYKDAEGLLLLVLECRIRRVGGTYKLNAAARGERIDPANHELLSDVKAVTMHRFSLAEKPDGWEATVVVDL